jgi:cytoskeletal protein CcmA (bactofilin family)
MFGNKGKDPMGTPAPTSYDRPAAKGKETTILGPGAHFTGNLSVDGSLEIHGVFEGTVSCSETLRVGPSGQVKAELDARDAVISGKVLGTITARERVELEKGSHFEGDVHSKTFMIQEGVFFQGNCSMGEDPTQKAATPSDDGKPELGILKQT